MRGREISGHEQSALGLQFDKRSDELYITDAYSGLLKVGPEGGLAMLLVTEAEGVPLRFTNDLDIDDDGNTRTSQDLSNHPYIYMRWKEQHFVNVGFDCGLAIAGFYYVCFSCIDGSIRGYYYDPKSTPFQKLELKTMNEEGRFGFSSSSYEFQERTARSLVV